MTNPEMTQTHNATGFTLSRTFLELSLILQDITTAIFVTKPGMLSVISRDVTTATILL